MSTAFDPQHQQLASPPQEPTPTPPPSGMDPVMMLAVIVLVVAVLCGVGYLVVVHPRLTAPIAAVTGVAGVLGTGFTVAVALRRR
ncbi:hypothetical protein ACF087_36410 [Streptomyces goshikiensis]|uniref:hypothetical protein n=1 Tax=Streptomyces goshikiensis TaxID=1942 RepID=UPI0036F8C016